ncbi:hypothetical protein ACFFOS_04410 [Nocardioides kongjuensis]|uniref:Uncharacterized protein n=1 Tax=Nocardioides kongjuensis TaxID=349522 RepID=A0A852R7V3_9ACTN|nr:hypothetical protein [Nocardioides kongjuensis]NYD29017.1 hypothetical protein [Nocardioides kongjuensis]
MTQHDDPTPDPTPAPEPVPATADVQRPPDVPPAPPAPAPVLKTRWRDRAFNLRAMVAVGLAGLVLGAGAGAGTALVAGHDDGPDFRHQRIGGPGEREFPGWDGRDDQGAPPPGMGQVPPGSPQDQDDPSSGTSQAPSSS